MLLTAALAVAAYCFWYFFYPYLITNREQCQLFLWNHEYFAERMAIPGGLAQYIGEWIVQFFIHPMYGALAYALLFVIAQWLGWKLLQRWFPKWNFWLRYLLSLTPAVILFILWLNPYIPMTPTVAALWVMGCMVVLPKRNLPKLICLTIGIPIGYWLVGPAILLLVLCCPLREMGAGVLLLGFCILVSSRICPYPLRQLAQGVDYHWEKQSLGTKEEMDYDMLLRLRKWDDILNRYRKEQPSSFAIRSAAALALYQTKGPLTEQQLISSVTTSSNVYSGQSSAFIMSEVYLHIGLVNMSQRAAFEAMESVPNYNKSARALRRLVETNLIIGQPDVARKYLAILDETLFYRNWSQKMRPLTEHPELVREHPSLGKLQKLYQETQDLFFY